MHVDLVGTKEIYRKRQGNSRRFNQITSNMSDQNKDDQKGTILDGLRDERENPRFSDVVVIVEEEEFLCHKVILSATSHFFDKMFSSGMKEALEGRVVVHDMPSEIFKKILSWMYHFESILSAENVFDIILVASQLGIDNLLSSGKTYVTSILSVKNWCSTLEISRMLGWSDLANASWDSMVKNFDKIRPSDVFDLCLDDMERLVQDPQLVTVSEDIVGQAVLIWVRGVGFEKEPLEYMDSDVDERSNPHLIDSLTREGEAFPESRKKVGRTLSQDNDEDTDEKSTDLAKTSLLCKNSKVHGEDGTANASTRISCLVRLLRLCRYLLFSSRFVNDALQNIAHVFPDSEFQALTKDIMQYKIQADTYQYWCPTAAVHRLSNSSCNTIMIVFPGQLYIKKAFDHFSRSRYIKVDLSFPRHFSKYTGWAFYERSVFFEVAESHSNRKTLYMYDPNLHEVVSCHENNYQQDVQTVAMLPVDNALIAVRSSNSVHTISRIENPSTRMNNWEEIGRSTIKGMEIVYVTDVGPMLVFIWSQKDTKETTIECFDLDRRTSFALSDKPPITGKVVAFKKGQQVFLFQDDGLLWQLSYLVDVPHLKIEREGQLWTGKHQLHAALLVCEELIVFITKTENDPDIHWCKSAADGKHFKSKSRVTMGGGMLGVLHVIVNKKAFEQSNNR